MNFRHILHPCLKGRISYESLIKLLHAVRNHVNSSNDDIQVIPKTDHYVLDGGSLIHRLKWTDGSTYNSIADAYASFTVDVHGNATVVFDGYDGGPSTKDNAHQRRTRTKVTNKVDISDATKFVVKKDDFLSNGMNNNIRTFAREGMSYHPGRRRCRLGHSESSCRNVGNTSRQLSWEKTLTCWSCCSIMHQRTTASTCTFGQTRVHQMYIT